MHKACEEERGTEVCAAQEWVSSCRLQLMELRALPFGNFNRQYRQHRNPQNANNCQAFKAGEELIRRGLFLGVKAAALLIFTMTQCT